ncbi:hypothetical protein BJ742DRAFT_785591 [Cladochytrium replicatum]|nr:hypothetical protein BJ742DRAFT_785591 [Cladochytrium replicatum]
MPALIFMIPLFVCYPFAYFFSYFVRRLALPWTQDVFSILVSSILCLSVFRMSTFAQKFGISVTSWILLIHVGLKSKCLWCMDSFCGSHVLAGQQEYLFVPLIGAFFGVVVLATSIIK